MPNVNPLLTCHTPSGSAPVMHSSRVRPTSARLARARNCTACSGAVMPRSMVSCKRHTLRLRCRLSQLHTPAARAGRADAHSVAVSLAHHRCQRGARACAWAVTPSSTLRTVCGQICSHRVRIGKSQGYGHTLNPLLIPHERTCITPDSAGYPISRRITAAAHKQATPDSAGYPTSGRA